MNPESHVFRRAMSGVALAALVALPQAVSAENFTLRIGSGHPSGPSVYVSLVENFFVPEVTRRVAEETEHTITFIEGYGGSDGWVEVRNGTHPDTPGGVTDWLHCRKGGAPVAEQIAWTDAVVANLNAFAEAVTGRAAYPWSEAELVGNIAVFEAICASADSGETVRLGQDRGIRQGGIR